MSINLAAIAKMLNEGLYSITGDYSMIPTQWGEVFDTGPASGKAQESSLETRTIGLAQEQAEGAAVFMDNNAGQRFSYNTVHIGIGLGFIITRNALMDNQYQSDWKPGVEDLKRSFQQTKEIRAANILNFGNVYDPNIQGDGVALFSTAHIIDGGTQANRPTVDIELQEAAIEAEYTRVRGFKNAAGLKIMARIRKLIVPPALEFTADRILYSEQRVGTADNDVNALRRKRSVPEGYTVMDFLSSAKAWFLKTDVKKGLTYTEREAFESDVVPDWETRSVKTRGYERYSFWYRDWRGCDGVFPT
jgi:hypothetical protein